MLWGEADDVAKKVELATGFTVILHQLTTQIKTQTNAFVVESQANAVTQMFNTLKDLNPGGAKGLSETPLFRTEANALYNKAANLQTYDYQREYFVKAANALNQLSPPPPKPVKVKKKKKHFKFLNKSEAAAEPSDNASREELNEAAQPLPVTFNTLPQTTLTEMFT